VTKHPTGDRGRMEEGSDAAIWLIPAVGFCGHARSLSRISYGTTFCSRYARNFSMAVSTQALQIALVPPVNRTSTSSLPLPQKLQRLSPR
jgi:hypothetical protein